MQNGECQENHGGSFGISKYPQRKQKIILKEEQKRAVKELTSGKDILAILSKGFGRSMIYMIFALVSQDLCPGYLPTYMLKPLVIDDQIVDSQ